MLIQVKILLFLMKDPIHYRTYLSPFKIERIVVPYKLEIRALPDKK